MRRQTSERRWVDSRNSKKMYGVNPLTTLYISGRTSRKPRRDCTSQKQPSGPTLSTTVLDRQRDIEHQELLLDKDHWRDKQTFSRECHRSRKRDRTNEDDTFMLHNGGPITTTYTGDSHLREVESRDIHSDFLKSKKGRW